MKLIHLREQILKNTRLSDSDTSYLLPHLTDNEKIEHKFSKKDREEENLCLGIYRHGDSITASGSYFVGVDWLIDREVAVQVYPKMNDGFEIDYIRMLNTALQEPDNAEHLQDLLTIRFDKPSIAIEQQQDLLSVFLITEYLTILQKIVFKGLKKSYYEVEENLVSKVKGRILTTKNVQKNLMKGHTTRNICKFQVYDLDSLENRILKKALSFCTRQLATYANAFDISHLQQKVRFIKPAFSSVGDFVKVNDIRNYSGNPVFKEYNLALKYAQLILRRYSYDITQAGRLQISTPPFWIDMSKLFELYVYGLLKKTFTNKEVVYHPKVHYQEPDYLLNTKEWHEPYVIDAKYKPYYKNKESINKDDARQVAGYARLEKIYQHFKIDENSAPPIKCLIIYPDQSVDETFSFSNLEEPEFTKVAGYVRMYKVGIRLPEIRR